MSNQKKYISSSLANFSDDQVEQDLTFRVKKSLLLENHVELDDTASTFYEDDTASTLYGSDTASILYESDAASTLYGSDTLHDDISTLIGAGKRKPSLSKGIEVQDLATLRVIVIGYNLKKLNNKEVIYVELAIQQPLRNTKEDLINNRYRVLWEIEKNYSDFQRLDAMLKGHNLDVELCEKNLFTTHVPNKIDKRKIELEQYFRTLCICSPNSDLCDFLNTDIVKREKVFGRTVKEAYLAREEGLMFKTWKSRYFVLQGSTFQFYETHQGGITLGSIPLLRAMIGTVKNRVGSDYQHCVAVLQFKKERRDGRNLPHYDPRHLLCAISDAERTDWENKLSHAMALITNVPEQEPKQSLLSKMSKQSGEPLKQSKGKKQRQEFMKKSNESLDSLTTLRNDDDPKQYKNKV